MQCVRCQRKLTWASPQQLQSVDFKQWLQLYPPASPLRSGSSSLLSSSYLQRRRYAPSNTAAAAHLPPTVSSTAFSHVRTFSSVTSPSTPPTTGPSSLSSLLSPTRRHLVARIRALLEELPAALRGLSLSADDRSLVRDTQQQLDQVFLLVVVGSAYTTQRHAISARLRCCSDISVLCLLFSVMRAAESITRASRHSSMRCSAETSARPAYCQQPTR